MKKSLKAFACVCMMAAMLAGCSRNDDTAKSGNTMNKTAENTKDSTKKAVKNTKNDMNDSIDNVMNYFKENGIAYENMQSINDMEFAAHEGRSFDLNGNTIYLYRVKNDDENMKKVIKDAKDNGRVKVRVNNKEQEYAAQVNGDYLMLYDTSADAADLQKLFPNYQPTGVHGINAKEDLGNADKTASTTEEDAQQEDNNSENQ